MILFSSPATQQATAAIEATEMMLSTPIAPRTPQIAYTKGVARLLATSVS